MKPIWNGKVIGESDKTINIEGNQYFPPESVNKEFLSSSESHTVCIWKGKASYFDVDVDSKTNKDAAWYYPSPRLMARKIKDYIAFWNGVEITN